MSEQNQEFAKRLLALADVYGTTADDLPELIFHVFTYDKEELRTHLRQFGGSWRKELSFSGSEFNLISQSMPVQVHIDRDKVCHKTVTWDCEPMFSPEEEQELDSALIEDPEGGQSLPSEELPF